MRINRLILLIIATIVIAAMSLSASYAQGSQSDGMVTCDADLILTLYVADQFFDFGTFADQLSSDMTINIDDFDKGQFAPLFEHAGMTDGSMPPMSDEMRDHMNEMMAMSDDEFEAHMTTDMIPDVAQMTGSDVSAMSMLAMRDVADESAECAALRSTLRRFFVGLAFAEVEFDGMSGGAEGAAPPADTTGTTDTGTAEGPLTLQLSGSDEVPGPGDEDGSGTATVYLRGDSNEVCVDVTVQNITLPATAAHIHRGVAGEAGPPVVTLTAPAENGVSNTCMTVEGDLMEELIIDPQNFYVNVHNDEFPDGAVRGQLP